MKQLDAKYNHIDVEKDRYSTWIEKEYFKAGDTSKKPYTIVIPPPNVTGKLHLGHAWDVTLQDIIARYKRLQGFDMLYLPGMDHAGIATQAKVDARLKEEGLSRYDLGREKFLERAWQWKEEYAGFIREQWGKMGISVDYSRERFTLDEGLNHAVTKVFVELYNEGLIYQGERIINWDTKAKTALSNIEVIHKEVEGAFYTFNYRVKETNETFSVATTRPETMFGDVCVVVHPDDEKYKHLIGKHAINPANHEEIIIIGDDYIDMEFGTGAMKCTPAHDPNDFMLAERHNLKKIVCMNPDGTMNELAGEFASLDRFECRKQLVERIKNEGNLVSIEKHIHQVGHSERTDVIVEPYLSKQWFVKMKPLADDALEHQKTEDKIQFFPSRFEQTFGQWMENIEDWCISRQLWWGHRIPAWYHKETKEVYVSTTPPVDIENYDQDEDVLDTWFSSALWPFSTLGWPDESADFDRYYPTQCLVTAYDIIFFWVARMIFQGRHFTNDVAFEHCLIHGLIRDEQGRKMSKSLGNGIDPMEVIEQYGVDALRLFLATNSTPGQDMRYIPSKVEASWNFINKLWNASRYVLMNLPEDFEKSPIENPSLVDEWIIHRFNETLEHTMMNMDKYEFAIAGNEIIRFVWDDFCSMYIEFSKAGLNSDDQDFKKNTIATLVTVLDGILHLLHPFIPFVTDEIYQGLHGEESSICISNYPSFIPESSASRHREVDRLIEVISIVRECKTESNCKPSKELRLCIYDKDGNSEAIDQDIAAIVYRMCKCVWVDSFDDERVVRPLQVGSIALPMSELVNVEEEILKLEKEMSSLEKEISRGENMLANPNFINKASNDKVESEKNKLSTYKASYEVVVKRLEELNKMR